MEETKQMAHPDFDVIIVGAGISGLGAAKYLQDKSPGKSFAILEGRGEIGGTWSLFKYPGIRSDSDMHTLGYSFKPWIAEKAIADAPSIQQYLDEVVDENDLSSHIHFHHMVKHLSWSTDDAMWTVQIENAETGETKEMTANFVSMCSGYYSYKGGYRPDFPNEQAFKGEIIHPQEWPEDLDYAGKRVVVIGSGATAVTIVPSMADTAEHITMLQRTPTYVVSRPAKDTVANLLRKILPGKMAYDVTRWKNISFQKFFYNRARTKPEKVKETLLDMTRKELGDELTDKHFTPPYNPWDQRLCLVPDNDLFDAIKSGKADVVTDHIDQFTEDGIKLKSGEELKADIIVTATGLNLVQLGGADISVDGAPVNIPETFTYFGMMFTGVPNLITTFGYINASWTLRADLIADYTCRLINHMDATGNRQCTPHLAEEDKGMQPRPYITDFPAGYMNRAMHLMPKQGDKVPWVNTQNYALDKKLLLKGEIEDGRMMFSNPRREEVAPELAAVAAE